MHFDMSKWYLAGGNMNKSLHVQKQSPMLVFYWQYFIIYILQGQQVETPNLGQGWESQVIQLDKGGTEYLSSQRRK